MDVTLKGAKKVGAPLLILSPYATDSVSKSGVSDGHASQVGILFVSCSEMKNVP